MSSDLRTTQKLPICEAPIHAAEIIEFWECTADAAGFAEVAREKSLAARTRSASQWPAEALNRFAGDVMAVGGE
jgi:hypothetical protein